MEFFRRRPLALGGFLFLAASLVAFWLAGWGKLALAAALLLPIPAYCLYIHFSGRSYLRASAVRLALLLVPAALAFLISFSYFDLYCDRVTDAYAGKPCEVQAVVTERDGGTYGVSYRVKTLAVNGERVSFPAVLRVDGACPAQVGDTVTVTCIPETLADFADDRASVCGYLSDGYLLGINLDADRLSDITVTNDGDLSVFTRMTLAIADLRNRMSLFLSDVVGGDAGSLASALLLGDRSGIADPVRRDFRRSGASHLLALSGLHVALLSAMAEWVLRRFRIPKRPRAVILGILMLLYLALTGFLLSATRAVLMLLLVYLSYVFSEDYDAPTSLFCSCALILAVSPPSVADVSFWMSFAATFGILALFVPFDKKFREWRKQRQQNKDKSALSTLLGGMGRLLYWAVSGLAISVAASVAVSAIQSLFADELPLLSPLTTLLLLPAVTVTLILSVLCFVSAGIPVLCAFFADLIRMVGKYLLFVTSRFAEVPGTTVPLAGTDIPYILFAMTGVLLVMLFLRFRRKWLIFLPPLAAAVAIAACVGLSVWKSGGTVSLTYLQSGTDSEQFVLVDDRTAVIIDFSDGYASRFRKAADVAAQAGCQDIRAVILTHYHQTHTSGVGMLTGTEYVRELWLPFPRDEGDYAVMNRLVRDAERSGTAVYLYRPGEELTLFGEISLQISTAEIDRSARDTFLMTLTDGDRSLSYFGAAVQESSLSDAAKTAAAESRILIFGAHGPETGEVCFDVGNVLLTADTILFANEAVLSEVRIAPWKYLDEPYTEILKNVKEYRRIWEKSGHQGE